MLWTGCLCSLKIHMLKPHPQSAVFGDEASGIAKVKWGQKGGP